MKAPYPPGSYDVLVFEHIPKTAGVTLRQVLWRRLGNRIFVHTNVMDPGPKTERLQELIRAGRPPAAISSHIGYGLHERLPGDLRYAHITMLRNPIDRTLSHYYWAIEQGNLPEGTTLIDFCRDDVPTHFPLRARNFQTAYLSGLRVRALLDGEPPRPEDHDEALLARAKANLDRFAAHGLVSRFEESLLLFGRTFGWPLVALRSLPRNVGKRRPRRVALTAAEEAALAEANRLDAALYAHAEARFEALLAERVPDAEGRLRSLSRLNRAYRAVAPAVNGLETLKRGVRRAVRT